MSTDQIGATPALGSSTLAVPAVEVRGVSKSFRGRKRRGDARLALDGFDLTVQQGEFVCLLGPSGCGKSTLLNLLAGFSTPDAGEVRVAGEPVRGPGPDRGVLFQSPMLFPWATVMGNVLYGPRARRQLDDDVRAAATELLRTVGLADHADAYPHELSGGMRHRAAFARVLINKPKLLLMDEPFAALDAITRAAMQRFLLDLWQVQRTTIVFVTHDVEEAVLLSDRVVVMSGSPGHSRAEFPVELPRPRSYEDADTLEFVAAKRRIRSVLNTEV
ncbi:NitT/TauT family transport system ATP-binding protein/sulfonate transport system ATP-binding protein [Motilibacter peucedani]|uniref:NitT/TauT family transport system ATP-binding protein/sulfonate transport system ATP-binding protein n=1 Tax=Motilibacter peucedani TaxID=598650 RepID=A0A420XPZ0_9ACTN|nr:ABC transporter ATP-binding protein [Motilibacter peucedani]RKS75302.1 NitT/TauT family transport system ATP-binding protein/sulfonate transport system ATP-binding protein [Motilibacter peucedani]